MTKHPFAAFAAAVGAVLTASQSPVPPSLLARVKQSIEAIEDLPADAAEPAAGLADFELAEVKAALVEQLLADGDVAKALAERLVAEITATQGLVDRLLERIEAPVLAGVDAYMAEKHPPFVRIDGSESALAPVVSVQGADITTEGLQLGPVTELPLDPAGEAPAAASKKKA